MQKMSSNELYRQIGSQIYRTRVLRKLSQEALAEAADVSRIFISRLENGNQSAKIDTYYRIACALDISLSEMFRGVKDAESMADILFLLSDCSDNEIAAFTEIVRVVKNQYTALCELDCRKVSILRPCEH